tara:strand:- start:5647 stop:5874 length:228 start_codon:yes stop_codon:yes gene_type:complete
VKSKVHYTWLGNDSKKTYIILSLSDPISTNTSSTKSEEWVQKYSARIAGIIAALYFTNNEAAHVWLKALAYLIQP